MKLALAEVSPFTFRSMCLGVGSAMGYAAFALVIASLLTVALPARK